METSKQFAYRVLNLAENNNTSPFYHNIHLYTDKGYDLVKDMDSPKFSIENIRNIAIKQGGARTLEGGTNLPSLATTGEMYESEPNITPLLAQVSTLFTQAFSFWENYAYSSPKRLTSPVPLPEYKKLVARAIELAEALGLGPITFCGTLWSILMNLSCIVDVPSKNQKLFFENIQRYLCKLEVYHQYSYWMNYHKVCMDRLGPDNDKTLQAKLASLRFGKLFKWE
ncbi:hypothetical protein LOD99_11440 [Oopsacas minuta]|uniref:Uncharacterized protein n=1 Tax=Oopsacas minuta TaxID=111878 RepID=A0AAV7K187_9METZ|nr:hypothetical protein LOD99_11440 [Oopsacas minuta]